MAEGAQIWDPLRRKMVALTPEERVRQWFIGLLRDTIGVPQPLMSSEVGLKYGAGFLKKEYRADILVYDRTLQPLMVVECKRPDVKLTEETALQALRYDNVLSVRYLALTNGETTYIFHREADRFILMDHAPCYEEMLKA